MSFFLLSFAALFAVTFGCVALGQGILASNQRQQVRRMLKGASKHPGKRLQKLFWDEEPAEGLRHLLRQFSILQGLELRILQAGMDWSLEKYVVLASLSAFAGFMAGQLFLSQTRIPCVGLIAAALLSFIPFLIVGWKRKRRFAQFEEQFPEALNFLSRAMRAGHAFTIGLEMLVADAPEPLKSCFRRVLSNLQLGSPLEASLGDLTQTVPLIDVRFFVSAVLLQQGTGGNLGEILDTMAQIMRERFRVKGAVKAASAHGRITGTVLCLMPPFVGAAMMVLNPDYLMKLVHDPLGGKLLIGSAVAQVIGYFFVRKIVRIKI